MLAYPEGCHRLATVLIGIRGTSILLRSVFEFVDLCGTVQHLNIYSIIHLINIVRGFSTHTAKGRRHYGGQGQRALLDGGSQDGLERMNVFVIK